MYLIAGLGKTGHSIARFLQRRHQPFIAFDTRKEAKAVDEFRRTFPHVEVIQGALSDAVISTISTVIVSPGVPLDDPTMQRFQSMNIPFWGDVECFAQEVRAPVIAITGTNGKSTVTTLVGDMVRAAGFNVAVAGNIGTPVLDMLDDGHAYDVWVLELSSFQLELTHSLAPLASTVLNITPDHLDRHHSLTAYVNAKHRIYQQARHLIYNRDDVLTFPEVQSSLNPSPMVSFGFDAPTDHNWGLCFNDGRPVLTYGTYQFLQVDELRIKGRHNWVNALASCALAHTLAIDPAVMVRVLREFSGLAHRTQWVRTLDHVEWVNDSKGTNVGATLSAIAGIGGAMQGKIVLIAGGQGKGADFTTLRPALSEHVRAVVLIGEDADLIESSIAGSTSVLRASSLDDAVMLAKAHAQQGDVVLLSPACASFDMFRDYNHRGESFIQAVNAL